MSKGTATRQRIDSLPQCVSLITLTQFNAFLASKAPEKACPECDTTGWGVTSSPDSPTDDNAIVFRGHILGSGGSIETYPMACHNCGYMKFFAADTVEAWVEENGGRDPVSK